MVVPLWRFVIRDNLLYEQLLHGVPGMSLYILLSNGGEPVWDNMLHEQLLWSIERLFLFL